MALIRTTNHTITRNGSPYIIAEIGNNHQGDTALAREMIMIAAKCGVSAIKLQHRNNLSLYTPAYYDSEYSGHNSFGDTYGKHREAIELPVSSYHYLLEYAHSLDVDFIVTVFDETSYQELSDLDVDAWKIASGDITNYPLIKLLAMQNKPVFISTGAATLNEVKGAIEVAVNYNSDIVVFHCVSQYPPQPENLNLNAIKLLRDEFPNLIVGYSSHEDSLLAAISAYSLGGVVIEKHFTLSQYMKGSDHKLSLNPEQMSTLVKELRMIETMAGTGEKIFHPFESAGREKLGKSIYACDTILKGEKITNNNVSIKSPGGGLPGYMLDKCLGKVANRNIDMWELITLEALYSE